MWPITAIHSRPSTGPVESSFDTDWDAWKWTGSKKSHILLARSWRSFRSVCLRDSDQVNFSIFLWVDRTIHLHHDGWFSLPFFMHDDFFACDVWWVRQRKKKRRITFSFSSHSTCSIWPPTKFQKACWSFKFPAVWFGSQLELFGFQMIFFLMMFEFQLFLCTYVF